MSCFDAVTTTTASTTMAQSTMAGLAPVNLSSILESLAALQPMVTPSLTPQSSICSLLSPPPQLDILVPPLSTPLITVPFSTMTITAPSDTLLSPLSLTSQLSPLSLASSLSIPSSSQASYNQIAGIPPGEENSSDPGDGRHGWARSRKLKQNKYAGAKTSPLGSTNLSPLLGSGLSSTFSPSQQLSPMDAGPSAFSRRQSAPENMLSPQVQDDRRRYSDFTVHTLLRRPSVGGVEQRKGSIGGRKPRTIYGAKQTEVLEEVFSESNYMVGPERELLAQRLGLSEAQVRVWFQNRRSKKRKRLLMEQAMVDKKGGPESPMDP